MELLGINFHNIIYYFLRIVKFKMKILAIICELKLKSPCNIYRH